MLNRTVPAAAEGLPNFESDALNAHMAGAVKGHAPSLADQIRAQMGRSVFHDDTDKPVIEATDQPRKFKARSVLRLESPVYDARSAARVAEFVAYKLLGGSDENSRTVTESECELLLYVVAHAARLAEAADDALQTTLSETDR